MKNLSDALEPTFRMGAGIAHTLEFETGSVSLAKCLQQPLSVRFAELLAFRDLALHRPHGR